MTISDERAAAGDPTSPDESGPESVTSSPRRRPTFLLTLGAVAVVIAMTGVYGQPYLLTVATQAAIFAIVALGLNVLVGYTGQISFGHNAFYGIGAYVSALSTTSWGLNPYLGILLGVALAILVALAIGYPTLRLQGHFLAMATLGIGLGFYSFAVASPYTHGFTGIGGIPPLTLGGLAIDVPYLKFWAVGLVLLVAIVAAYRLQFKRYGRALRGIASDEATAQSIGIDVRRYKLSAFVVSAVFAAVAGSLFSHTTSYISPESFSFATILTFFMMLFIGGSGSVWGAVIGAVIVTSIPEALPSSVQEWQPTIFACLLMVILIVRPSGLLAPRGTPSAGLARNRGGAS
jgi:branched-chain amino acid transport system permease protein